MTDYGGHIEIWHNPNGGRCGEFESAGKNPDACPQAGMVRTVDGSVTLADDPTRQWTEHELDEGLPWKGSK